MSATQDSKSREYAEALIEARERGLIDENYQDVEHEDERSWRCPVSVYPPERDDDAAEATEDHS